MVDDDSTPLSSARAIAVVWVNQYSVKVLLRAPRAPRGSECASERDNIPAKMKAYALEFAGLDFQRHMLDRHWPFDDQDEQE